MSSIASLTRIRNTYDCNKNFGSREPIGTGSGDPGVHGCNVVSFPEHPGRAEQGAEHGGGLGNESQDQINGCYFKKGNNEQVCLQRQGVRTLFILRRRRIGAGPQRHSIGLSDTPDLRGLDPGDWCPCLQCRDLRLGSRRPLGFSQGIRVHVKTRLVIYAFNE